MRLIALEVLRGVAVIELNQCVGSAVCKGPTHMSGASRQFRLFAIGL